ncbi:MAG TPA: PhzF family phenazine biosynthesis protein [Nitrospirales bacterium]|nr:PhzF family phenazine biosynthesis protein [Nitrospirales bacterium]
MSGESRSLKFYQADVFTNLAFGGNPVAVVPDAVDLTDQELQQIAREMNLSETVFVLPPTEPAAAIKIRIFTPTQEIPFAGHPVIGAFYVLSKLKRLPIQEPVTRVLHECNIGVFPVEIHARNGDVLRIVMSQPRPEFLGVLEELTEILEVSRALGIAKELITRTKFPIALVSTGLPVMIVPVRTLTAVRHIIPDIAAINELCGRYGVSGVMVFTTMTVEDVAAVHTRMFASPIGVTEDPATGSASGALGAYLVQHGVVEVAPTTEIIAEQGYEVDRPSRLLIQVESDDDVIQSVKVGGQAVLVIEGTLTF